MTIEVRQLVIRAQVGVRPAATGAAPAPSAREIEREIQRARAQILAECKAWLREQLAATRDR